MRAGAEPRTELTGLVGRMLATLALALVAGGIIFLLVACERPQDAKKVSLAEKLEAGRNAEVPLVSSLRVAVAAIISPYETFDAYRDLLRYLEERLGIPTELVQRESYQEINELIGQKKLEVAFICTGAYVEGRDSEGMELLVAPQVKGEPVYYSYIIAAAGASVRDLEDMRGMRFAFTDPLSNTGYLAPRYLLLEKDETVERFFQSTIFTHSHDRSIEAVAKGLVDGAAVDSLVYDALAETKPQLIAKLKIVARSPPFGIPPVVVPRELPSERKEQLRSLLLAMHADPTGKDILRRLGIDRFVQVDDSLYDRVREMLVRVRAQDMSGG